MQFRDPGPIAFDALIARPDPGAYVTVAFDSVEVFGVRAWVPVTVRFDDLMDYTGSPAPYGAKHRLGVRKDVQALLAKTHDDTVHVELRLDTTGVNVG